MNVRKYLKSKEIIIYIQVLLNLVIGFYTVSTYGNTFNLVVMLVILDLNFFGLLIYDYVKFRKIINNLSETEKCLDQKFLIKDVQNHHMGYEESQIYDVLDRIVKSQYEIIKQKDYEIKEEKEYRSIWIHDIKQPLAILKEDNLGNYDRAMAVSKISKKLNYMLYYDKIDNIANDLYFDHLNLRSLVNDCLKEQAMEMVRLDSRISIDIPEEIIVYSDKFWLQFIIEQILSNAIKYRDINTPLKVKFQYEQDENYQRLYIEDNGIGIPAQDLKNIFDKGYRGINAKANGTASGLGLYYVQTIANHLSANIKIINSEDGGVRACLEFPKVKEKKN